MSIAIQSTPGSSSTAASASSPSLQEAIRLASLEAERFESRAALVLVIDARGLLLHASSTWERIFGEPPGAVLGRAVLQAIAGERLSVEQRCGLTDGLRAALLDGAADPIRLHYHDTGLGWRALEGRPYGAGDENRIVIFHDVTDAFEELLGLAESESRFRRVAEASRDIVTETDLEGRFTYASGACEDVLGFAPEELIERPALSFHHPEDVGRFRREVLERQGTYCPFHVTRHRLRHKQGHWIWAEATGVLYRRPDGQERVLGVARDITRKVEEENERREIQERMLRSQKLESLGVLAGGVAHDFNNLLTPIVGNAGLLLADLPAGLPARRWAEAIRSAGHRATALTTQMLAYAGQTGRQVTMMDVSGVIEDVSLLLETTASSACRVRYDLDRKLPPVHGDTAQITQVVMNLVANASEAQGPDGGRIDIRTYALEADRELLEGCYLGEERRDGLFVVLEVIDDGPGLEAEIRERIFDPFFTTKFTGRGLGLAVVLGAVQAHEGALQIESVPGRGTCFRILLPGLRHLDAADRPAPAPAAGLATGSGELATLLVVDDDPGARELTTTLLSRAGFGVLAAASGQEAIAAYRRRGHEIAGVLLDGTMPGMSGAHVFEALRQLDPDVRVILVSGYARDRAADPLLERGLSGFLHKPYEPEDLLGAVRELLEPS